MNDPASTHGLRLRAAGLALALALSAVGARVWELIESPRDVESVCSELEQEFDVAPDLCRAEVDAFVRELAKHGAIALDPAAAG